MSSKTLVLGATAGVLALFGFQFYNLHSMNARMDARLGDLQGQIQSAVNEQDTRIASLSTSLNAASERIGETSEDIMKQTQKTEQALKKEQSKSVAELHSQLDQHAKAVDALRQEAVANIEAVKQETSTQIGAVNGDVKAVNGQVEGVKTDLNSARADLASGLASNRKEITDVRDALGRQIAHNDDELSILKRRGERNYIEFNIAKSSQMERVGDIQLQLTKADTKAQRFDVNMLVSDTKVAKKGQIINEPVPLLVGQNHIRYELVVNSVEKDRIRGYISTPKDVVLSAEGPKAH